MKEVKTRYINFRLTDVEWQKVEAAAEASGEENINEWSRKFILVNLGESANLTRNERILFEEIARTRLLLTHGFTLLAKQELTATEWKQIIELASKNSRKIADTLLAKKPAGDTV